MRITLRLTHDERAPVADAVGWYLPGNDAAAWVQACCQTTAADNNQRHDLELLQFFIAPTSSADATATGLIALMKVAHGTSMVEARPKHSIDSAHKRPAAAVSNILVPPGAVPLIRLASQRHRMFIPVLTSIEPAISVADFGEIGTHSYVWLPEQGLIGFEPDDQIDLSVLLRPALPVAKQPNWLAPPPTQRLPDRLADVRVEIAPQPEDLFDEERESIGNEADQLMDIDDDGRTSGGGPLSALGRATRAGLNTLARWLAAAAQKLSAAKQPTSGRSPAAPRSAPSAVRVARPPSTISMKLARQMAKLLSSQRDKQIDKLLRLMERAPERALKYAVPLAQFSAGRGISPPSAQLGKANVDFSLAGLFGGGQAADFWDINAQRQLQLRQAYQAQAKRELDAGRYRRAAYIYAHLLGDLITSAQALERGQHYSEAAVLFERASRKQDQVRCLVACGQLTAAAALYEQLGDHLGAGKMWERVEEFGKANLAFEAACQQFINQEDILAAVNVLDEHLKQPQRIEPLLWKQWPGGAQVFESLQMFFNRLGVSGQHSEARNRFSEMVQTAQRPHHTVLARLASKLGQQFPDAELRAMAEDQCRQSAVDRLDFLSASEVHERLGAIAAIHPNETLLQRDLRRFEKLIQQQELRLQPDPIATLVRGKLRAMSKLTLPAAEHATAMMVGQELFVVTWSEAKIECWRYKHPADGVLKSRVVLHGGIERAAESSLDCCFQRGSDPVQILILDRTNRIQIPSTALTAPTGGDKFWAINHLAIDTARAAALADDGTLWTIDADYHLRSLHLGVPQFYDFQGIINSLPDGALKNVNHIGMTIHGNQPLVILDRVIVTVSDGKLEVVLTTPEPINFAVPSLPYTTARLLVATDNKLFMVNAGSQTSPEVIEEHEPFTHATFMAGGRIAVATATDLTLYERTAKAMVKRDRVALQHNHRGIIALLSLSAEVVGVLYASSAPNDGCALERWQIS